MNFPKIRTDYLKQRASSNIMEMPVLSRKFYEEILQIEKDLDELCPGWDTPLRMGAIQGMRGLKDFECGSMEELGEIKKLLTMRKLRYSGNSSDVVISYCQTTGRPVVVVRKKVY